MLFSSTITQNVDIDNDPFVSDVFNEKHSHDEEDENDYGKLI